MTGAADPGEPGRDTIARAGQAESADDLGATAASGRATPWAADAERVSAPRPLAALVVVRSRAPTVAEAARSAWAQRELLVGLARRDLRTRYNRSVLGWGWSLLHPVVITLVYAYVFTVLFDARPAPGDPSGETLFAVFLLSALLPWQVVNGGIPQAMGALLAGSSLMGKVNFAREHLVLGSVLATVVSFLVELAVLTTFVTIRGHAVILLAPVIILLTVLLGLFCAGISLWLAAVNVRYRDMQHLISVALLVTFYLTPVLYAPSLIPERHRVLGIEVPLRDVVMASPIARFVDAYRTCFFDVRVPRWTDIAYLVIAAAMSSVLGYRYFIRRAGRFIEDM